MRWMLRGAQHLGGKGGLVVGDHDSSCCPSLQPRPATLLAVVVTVYVSLAHSTSAEDGTWSVTTTNPAFFWDEDAREPEANPL